MALVGFGHRDGDSGFSHQSVSGGWIAALLCVLELGVCHNLVSELWYRVCSFRNV